MSKREMAVNAIQIINKCYMVEIQKRSDTTVDLFGEEVILC